MPIIKVQKKGQVTLPTALREQVGVSDGDLLEVRLQNGSFVLRPKTLFDRSQFTTADDEYSPAQRRIIDARLAKADADIKAGRVSRPFDTHEEFIADLHKQAGKHRAKRTKRSG
jgi:AbrB family looped-hinge helix DNA binding protein